MKMEFIAKYFEECTGKTAIHGVRYIGDRSRSWVERLLWLIVVAISVTMCTILVLRTYRKWETSPVYVTIGTGQVPIHNVEFPAVTICPESKTNRDIFYYPDVLEQVLSSETNVSDIERLQFEYMSMVCNRSQGSWDLLQIEMFDPNIFHFYHNITPNLTEIFTKCYFASIEQNCEDMFTPIFTRDGICYTFNILDRSELFWENIQQFMNYHKAPRSVCFKKPFTPDCVNIYPRRASFSGVEAGLEVELRTTVKNLDYNCGSALQGFKVILHDPSEIPTQNHNYFRLSLNEATFTALTPQVISTSSGNLRRYSAQQRRCYFDDEKSLLRFKHYSQFNCEIECLAYIMSNVLDCLDFYLPHTNSTQNICGAGLLVYVRALEKLLIDYVSNSTSLNLSPELIFIKELMKEFNEAKDTENHCKCLPSCSSTDYRFETTQTKYYWYRFQNVSEEIRDQEFRSLVNIYFKDAQYIPMQREEMFGAMDFIAYSGGLLGLFIGFSFISLVEIIYFLTLKIGCNMHMYGRKMWHGV